MTLAETKIRQSKNWLKKVSPKLSGREIWCQILSDPSRVKIIMLLERHKELCVSDLSKILGLTVSAVSHQLRLLERYKLVAGQKAGKEVYYSLTITDQTIFRCLSIHQGKEI